ncbi:maleylpyruvate isomerase N-terminal domain-containing protein [soil metagenome]
MRMHPVRDRLYVGRMTRLAFPDYLDHIRIESARFRAALTDCDPAARVPACPDWDAADLLWHLAEVQWFWSRVVAGRPAGPDELTHPERPATYDGLLAAFDEYSAGLVATLEAADPAEAAWTWAPEQSVGFTFRRQAHEALIHRLDAEQTAGTVTALDATLDPALATDGVQECLAVMYGGCPDWGRFTPDGAHAHFDLTDVGTSLWVSIGRFDGKDPDTDVVHDEPDLSVVDDPGTEPDVLVRATAAELDAWLWKRAPQEAVSVTGDDAARAHLAGILGQGIN